MGIPVLHHKERAVLLAQGEGLYPFLQGLITNDIFKLKEQNCLYTALLTPQGRFLFDFFLFQQGEDILIDCLVVCKEALQAKLNQYKLRTPVLVEDVSSIYGVCTLFDKQNIVEGIMAIDPRHAQLGYRAIVPKTYLPIGNDSQPYEHLRLSLGIPEALKDIIPEKSIPLECGLDLLNAIAWDKGCYLGQELTSRTHYRGQIRKRLLPVRIEGELSESLQIPIFNDDLEVGTLYSRNASLGIAHLRIDDVKEAINGSKSLRCESSQLFPYLPDWLKV